MDDLDIEGVEARFCRYRASRGFFQKISDRHTITQKHRHTDKWAFYLR